MCVWFWKLKRFLLSLVALCFCAMALIGIMATKVVRFSDIAGERTFYLYSASSQGLQKQTLRLSDIDDVRGESVRFVLQDGQTATTLIKDLAKRYGATVRFSESACGVTSYYCYTPRWQDFIWLYGQEINLHVAISEDPLGETAVVVGSPIVFGGF